MAQTPRNNHQAAGLVPMLFSAALLVSVAGLSGCYQRVTRATGFGADQYQVSEPYQESGRIDDWFWGKPPQNRTGSRLPPSPQRN